MGGRVPAVADLPRGRPWLFGFAFLVDTASLRDLEPLPLQDRTGGSPDVLLGNSHSSPSRSLSPQALRL